jgi:hypothetical protein
MVAAGPSFGFRPRPRPLAELFASLDESFSSTTSDSAAALTLMMEAWRARGCLFTLHKGTIEINILF